MTVFKLNDKIECVNPGNECLTKGKVYTVTGVTEYWVLVDSDSKGYWYDPTRFKLYEEKEMQFTKAMLKTGMRVVHGKHPRQNEPCIVINDLDMFMFKDGGYNYISSYSEELKNSHVWDVTAVYAAPERDVLNFDLCGELLWQKVEQTPEQKQLQEVMTKISELQNQANKLQELVNK